MTEEGTTGNSNRNTEVRICGVLEKPREGTIYDRGIEEPATIGCAGIWGSSVHLQPYEARLTFPAHRLPTPEPSSSADGGSVGGYLYSTSRR